MKTTVGRLVRKALAISGVDAVYGGALDDLAATPVARGVAPLFASAHERLTGRGAAVYRGGGVLVVGGTPDSGSGALAVTSVQAVLELPSLLAVARPSVVHVDVDLAARVEAEPFGLSAPGEWSVPDAAVVERVKTSGSTVVLAGPGTLSTIGIHGVHELAAAGRLGVVNTWGAKGLFDWRSRHHWATAGLQEGDVALGGLADADLVIATGLDPDEAPLDRWTDIGPVVHVEPAALRALAELVPASTVDLAYPPLRTELAAVAQRGWVSDARPIAPSRATMHYAEVLGADGVLGADAGTAGWWVARTFATVAPRRVHVPAHDEPGAGVACAVVARLLDPDRPVLAAVDGPLGPEVRAVLAEARRLGVGLGVEVWDAGGDALGPDEHRGRCRHLSVAEDVEIVTLATDARQLDEMIAVAGPTTAWRT